MFVVSYFSIGRVVSEPPPRRAAPRFAAHLDNASFLPCHAQYLRWNVLSMVNVLAGLWILHMSPWKEKLDNQHVHLALTALASKVLQSFIACRYIAAKESFKAGSGGAQNLGWSGHYQTLEHWEEHPLAYANTVGCLCCAPEDDDDYESYGGEPLQRTFSHDESSWCRWCPCLKGLALPRALPSAIVRSPRARQPKKW